MMNSNKPVVNDVATPVFGVVIYSGITISFII